MPTSPDAHAVMTSGVEAFNNHKPEGFVDLFAEDGTFDDPAQDEPLSKTELREYMAEVLHAFPDARIEIERVMAAGDEGAIEATFRGTHEGAFEGLPPTARTIAVPYTAVAVLSEDGVTSWTEYWDKKEFADQLGLTFPTVIGQIPKLAWGAVKERT